MTVKELRVLLESLPDDLNVVVDVEEFGQEHVKSANVVELFCGMTGHSLAYYQKQNFFMRDDVKKEKVVYLSGHR